jgi:hypothetical protein
MSFANSVLGQVLVAIAVCALVALALLRSRAWRTGTVPVSVNYHFTRKCNK